MPIRRGPIARIDIELFAAATNDFHPIHLDEDYAKEMGLPSVITHGPLTVAFMAQALQQNFGASQLRKVAGQFRAPVFPGDRLTVEGVITSVFQAHDGWRVGCEMTVTRHEGDLVARGSGEAKVEMER